VLDVGHDVNVDAFRTAVLRDVLASTGWVERAREFATRLRRSTEPGGLMLVGTPQEEPWHMAAHLANEAELARLPQLNPTLLRWAPPVTAPVHLTVGVDRLATARRGESVLVITGQLAPVYLLERVEQARKGGATVLTLDTGDRDLESLAHEVITVPGLGPLPTTRRTSGLIVPSSYDEPNPYDEPGRSEWTPSQDATTAEAGAPGAGEAEESGRLPIEALVNMDVVQHLVATAASEPPPKRELSGWQRRLARLLDRLSGPPPSPYP
jgi:hypothetical protein